MTNQLCVSGIRAKQTVQLSQPSRGSMRPTVPGELLQPIKQWGADTSTVAHHNKTFLFQLKQEALFDLMPTQAEGGSDVAAISAARC